MIFNKKIIISFFFAVNLNLVKAQNESPQELVSKFLDIVEKSAYNSSFIKWDSIRPALIEETKSIKDPAELQPYFKKTIKNLRDYHSGIFYMKYTGEDLAKKENEVLKMYATITYEEAGHPPLEFKSKLIDDKYGYILIPPVTIELKNYIKTIGKQLQELDAQNPKAWIFDLTENEGGDMTPMLWNMYYLVDQEYFFTFVDNKNIEEKEKKELWNIKNADEEIQLQHKWAGLDDKSILPKKLINTSIPIIILTSNKTASSGEFFVAGFKGQKNVTIIGQKTAGLTSGNEAISLNNEYAINLTTCVLKDRLGKVYKIGEGIIPDIFFDIDKNLTLKDYEKQEIKQKYLDVAIKYLEQD